MSIDSRETVRDWYQNQYGQVNASANGSIFERYTHAAMERSFGPSTWFAEVLEIGGDRGQHVPYVRHEYDSYLLTDLVLPDPLPEVAANSKVIVRECDATQLPFDEGAFDRVIVTCVLHHVHSPLDVVQELRRVVKPGGVLSLMIPTDPGFAYRAGKALTSGRAAKKLGVGEQGKLVAAFEHHNHFRSIRTQLESAFKADRVRVQWAPFKVPSVELNAFTVWTIRRA